MQQATASPPPAQSNAELKAQIKQTIIDAQQAARDAQVAAQDAQRAAQDRQSRVIRVGPGVPTPPVPPGFTLEQGFPPDNSIPSGVVDISIAFFGMCAIMVIGWPLARAFGKRLEKRGDVAAVSPAVTEQLQRIERAVDAMSIEVERISEAQRFMARLQNEGQRAALPGQERV